MEQTLPKTEVVYSYQHANGEAVTVGSFEEALGKCAVLGAETPEKARLFFDLYARGVEVMSEDAHETEEAEEPEAEEIEEKKRPQEQKTDQPKLKNEAKTNKPQAKKTSIDKPSAKEEQPAAFKAGKMAENAFTEPVVESVREPVVERPTNYPPAKMLTATKGSIPEKPLVHTEHNPEPVVPASSVRPMPVSSPKQEAIQEEAIQETTAPEPLPAVEPHFQAPVPAQAELPAIQPESPVLNELGLPDTKIDKDEPVVLDRPHNEQADVVLQTDAPQAEHEFPIPEELSAMPNTNFQPDALDITEELKTSLDHEVLEMSDENEDVEEMFIIPEEAADTISLYIEQKPETIAVEIQVPELRLPVKEVELVINQFAEKIERLEPEKAGSVNEIMDKIVEIPQELKVITEDEARERLSELFIQLFDRLEIEYTPELVEDFVTLAISGRLEQFVTDDESDETLFTMPTEKGTHEFITKILSGIARLKKALLNAYMLGKSALSLYRLQEAQAY